MQIIGNVGCWTVAAGAIGAALTGTAHAAVVTFGTGGVVATTRFVEEGFEITRTGSDFFIADLNDNAERELLAESGNLPVTFALESGGAFDLVSLDVEAGTRGRFSAGTFDLSGSNGASSSITADGFGTLMLVGFTGITSATLSCPVAFCQGYIDNIVFEPSSAAAPVPLPAGLALLLTGVAGLALVNRASSVRSGSSSGCEAGS
ncbi:MAG: hypothetical protein AAFR40_18065 [Pseudomonadota bacterium]